MERKEIKREEYKCIYANESNLIEFSPFAMIMLPEYILSVHADPVFHESYVRCDK